MRTANRTPVTLKIKFKSTTLEQFIERYSVDISHGGIFIRTKDPLPVGTNLKFEFQLKDASPLITGDGTVVWTRDFDPTRSGVAPGMGVRFDRLPSESQEVLEKILAHKTAKLGKAPESFLEAPTKVSFGNVPTKVAPKDIIEGLAQAESRRTLLGVGMARASGKGEDVTPLPNPQPFHADLDEFPDEAFEEATKVAALDALARRSVSEESGANPVPFGKSLEDDVTVERRGRVSRPPGPRETGPVAVGAAGAAASAAAPIFHDLPGRAPFPGASVDPALNAERTPAADVDLDDRPDPFSLPPPSLRDEPETEPAARPSHRLRIVTPAPPDEPAESEAELPQAQGSVTGATPVRRDGSNLPWIAAAAGVLLVGGITGFLLLSGGEQVAKPAGQKSSPAAAPAPVAAAAPAGESKAPAAAAQPAPAAAAQGGLQVTITSEPEGAMAELIGGTQSGLTPITFQGLVAGQHYQVKLSKPGYVLAEMTLKPEAGNPAPFELEAKPSVLRVTSEPAGAQVWINGRRQRSLTPVDVRLSRRTTESKQVKLALRKSGYSTAEQQISLDDLVDQGDAMVQEVALVLARRPPAAEAAEESATEDGEEGGSDDASSAGDSDAVGPAKGKDGEASSSSSDQDAAESGESEKSEKKGEGDIVKPDIPDWMKP